MAALPWPGVVGVSGGSDSLALMHLLADWARAEGKALPLVATVDHGLRPEAKAEARQVVAWAKAAGMKAVVLRHQGPVPDSDVEAAARAIRYALMGGLARRRKCAAVYVAHTEDDQAETFLIRLARGSGVDGLSGMRIAALFPAPEFPDLAVVRPLLSFSRSVLRDYLAARGQVWIDDPMNGDPRFTRVRMRQAMPALAALGLTPQRLVEACAHLSRARDVLELAAEAVRAEACHPLTERGDIPGVLIDPAALIQAPAELGLRTLASVLMTVSGAHYRPRFERLQALYGALAAGTLGGGRTLHGCRIAPAPARLRLYGPATLLVTLEKGRSPRSKTSASGPTNS